MLLALPQFDDGMIGVTASEKGGGGSQIGNGCGQNKTNGGEAGIRTLGRGLSPYNGLANRRLQPLGHLTCRGTAPRTQPVPKDTAATGF